MTEREAGNEEKHSADIHSHYEEVVQRKIRLIFERFINPSNVVNVFWKYNENVLVKRDIQLVEAVTNNTGMGAGAAKLLELLPLYKDWLPCLLQVLRDKEVNQNHVAEMILYSIEKIQSDNSVDIKVKALAEKDVSIERLKTELEELKINLKEKNGQHAAIEREMLELKDQAEKTKENQDKLIQELRMELEETKRNLKKEKDRHVARDKEMVEQMVQEEKNKQYQDTLIKELREELDVTKESLEREEDRRAKEEKEILEQKALVENENQKRDMQYQILLQNFSDLINALLRNATDMSKMESLMLRLAESGQYNVMEVLKERVVDVNKTDSAGKTALMFAAEAGYVECVNWLIGYGADVYKTDKTGNTALCHASAQRRDMCIQALLEAGSHECVDKPNLNGQTPLMLAARSERDNIQCLQHLLNAGADINMKDMLGYTALAHAAENGNVNCVETLLEAGSQTLINISNTDSQTPLMLAAGSKGDNVQCLQKLLSAGADPNLEDFEGAKALQYAARNQNVACKQLLQDAVPDSNVKSKCIQQ